MNLIIDLVGDCIKVFHGIGQRRYAKIQIDLILNLILIKVNFVKKCRKRY
jgi:hypothetical protein